jgi:hypothetical protein
MTEHAKQAIVKAFGAKWNSNYSTGQKLSIFLGVFGADRFYVGDVWLGAIKLIMTIPIFGGIPNGLIISIPFWIIDIFIVRAHKKDWSDWISNKQVKRAGKKLEKERIETARIEQLALEAERKAEGLCPKCGSDKIQAVTEVNSQAQLTDAFANILPHGNTHLEQKVRSKTLRMCLKCGNKFA